MSDAIKLLDHGHCRLVDSMGSDLSIVRNARVSYDADWRAGEDEGSDSKLIKYLYRNGHNTPFEAVTLTFDVKAPIFVFRQWHRHRTQSFNELSARYKELPEEFYIPQLQHIGTQAKGNKQCRDISSMSELEFIQSISMEEHQRLDEIRDKMRQYNKTAFTLYREMLADGVPREIARTVLPLATYSHMFATVNLHNLFRFLGERLHTHAQYEIRVYAQAMLELIKPVAPVAVAAFEDSQND